MKKLTFLLVLSIGIILKTNAQTITTIAGNGTAAYVGDGGQATLSSLNKPRGVAVDNSGNVYIADNFNNVVRKVNTSGIITTFAGNGTGGYYGDGGQASVAELNNPIAIAVDVAGNVYVSDELNAVIRKINISGIISSVAGNGSAGFSGDGGQATLAELNYPVGVSVDATGNIYISDFVNNRVRKVDTLGIISTLAGNGTAGYSGDGAQATAAEMNGPHGVTVDGSGNVYFGDYNNHRLREISVSGIINTLAGNGTASFSGDGGPATAAEINSPVGLSVDASGNIYFADYNNNRIREISTSGIINTIAGNGIGAFSGDGGSATAAEIYNPYDAVTDHAGNIYIADSYNNRIRKITSIEGINELFAVNKVSIYPNPSNGKFTIEVKGEELKGVIEIYNMLGEQVFDATLKQVKGNNIIDISNQSAGIYFYRILTQTGNMVATGKFVIQ